MFLAIQELSELYAPSSVSGFSVPAPPGSSSGELRRFPCRALHLVPGTVSERLLTVSVTIHIRSAQSKEGKIFWRVFEEVSGRSRT